MAIETIEDSIDIKVFCNNEICADCGKEMKYESIKQEPSTLRISSMCVGCCQKTKIVVKL